MSQLRVTVWGENRHEQVQPDVRERYPEGMHGAIAAGLAGELDAQVRTATLDEPDHGLGGDVLAGTDVLTWWGHIAHDAVSDAVVEAVCARVYEGMGLVMLHSGHFSKLFRRLMGTTCSLHWRDNAEREVVWTVAPGHPIAAGLPNPFVVPRQETYGEPFDIPAPDELVFISSFSGGEVFRSGCCYTRGAGRIFYFSPGDQAYPVYFQPEIRRVLANAVLWAARVGEAAPTGPLRPEDMHVPEPGWFLGPTDRG